MVTRYIRHPLPDCGLVCVGWSADLSVAGRPIGRATIIKVSDDGVVIRMEVEREPSDGAFVEFGYFESRR